MGVSIPSAECRRWRLLQRIESGLAPGIRVMHDTAVPTALRLIESVTSPSGTLQLAYETAGAPTYGNLA
jgi:hypothetical protein